MTIGVVGLGLIGGSFCKAIKNRTLYKCLGADIDKSVVKKAMFCSAIDEELTQDKLKECDVVIVCLYPKQTVEYIKENLNFFKEDSLIYDTCGVKGYVLDNLKQSLENKNFEFLGTHPMAGREFSGFDYSIDNLYENSSLILTPTKSTSEKAIDTITKLAKLIGFGRVVKSTAEIHDQTIAYTSQLAHVVSNAYVKSDTLNNESGFSAGSFLDLTRVARLNEKMWTPLFMANKEPLVHEIKTIIKNLKDYQEVLEKEDWDELEKLLKNGSDLKIASLERRVSGKE